MRATVLALALLLAANAGRGGEVPDPLFWGSEADFLEQLEEGQFNDRLELHLLQYSADPGWRAEWAGQRYSGSGVFGEFGSTTGKHLYVDSQIALNLFLAKRLQMRYDRRDYRDGRFDVSDQRFDAVWHAGAGWGVILTGWPTFDKEDASLGLGVRIGAPRSRNALQLLVLNERFMWNQKTGDDVRIHRRPFRLLADGSWEAGPWRLHGSVDFGLEYRAEEALSGRSARGYQRFADVALEHARNDWAAGVRLTAAALRRDQTEPAGGRFFLDRSWGRAVVTFQKQLGKWRAEALAGYAAQRDDFSSPAGLSGSYDLGSLLFGVEGGLQAWKGLEVRLGYLGSSDGAHRTVTGSGSLPDRDESAYIDKAHLRAIYTFAPSMKLELLLSQAVQGGSFGGGSMKVLLVY